MHIAQEALPGQPALTTTSLSAEITTASSFTDARSRHHIEAFFQLPLTATKFMTGLANAKEAVKITIESERKQSFFIDYGLLFFLFRVLSQAGMFY